MRVTHEADTWKAELNSHHVQNVSVQSIKCELLRLTDPGRRSLQHGTKKKFSQDPLGRQIFESSSIERLA